MKNHTGILLKANSQFIDKMMLRTSANFIDAEKNQSIDEYTDRHDVVIMQFLESAECDIADSARMFLATAANVSGVTYKIMVSFRDNTDPTVSDSDANSRSRVLLVVNNFSDFSLLNFHYMNFDIFIRVIDRNKYLKYKLKEINNYQRFIEPYFNIEEE